jgi:hypothetical protein
MFEQAPVRVGRKSSIVQAFWPPSHWPAPTADQHESSALVTGAASAFSSRSRFAT